MRRTTLDEQVSPFDALMIESEDEPRARSSIVVIFALAASPDWRRLQASFERASRLTVRLRQRAVFPTVALGPPRWVVDPDFDLSYHLRRARLPEPGDHRALLDWVTPLLMNPLDRGRPLWEAHLVEGLQRGMAAVVMKFNHSLFDGIGAIKAMGELFDLEADQPPAPMPPVPVPSDVEPGDVLREDLRALPVVLSSAAAGGLRQGAAGLLGAVRRPTQAAGRLGARLGAVGAALGPGPAPRSSLMGGRSTSRRLFTLDVGLDELKRAGKAVGGTLNDAYLAAVTGAVSRYHGALGVDLTQFPMAIPVNLRSPDDPHTRNRWAGVRIAAPAGEADPRRRMSRIGGMVARARRQAELDALALVLPVAWRLPRPILAGLAGRAISSDVQASNIPGWSVPLYLAGTEVRACYPFGPLPGVAMMVVLISACGTCYVGVNYDPAAVTEAALMQSSFRESFDEVLEVGREGAWR